MNPLAVRIAGVTLESPLVLASGVLGTTASSLRRVAEAGAGAVTTKSCSLAPRQGHSAPCILPWKGGMLNAVGLSNPGAERAAEEIAAYKRTCATPLIASIFSDSPEAFGKLARIIAGATPDLIEVNVSCPNVESEFGTPFAADAEALAAVTRAVKENAGGIPVAIKLSVQCASIARMAEVCAKNGADVITAINTVGPGMWIDTEVGRPVLSNQVGGVSGSAILPIAVRAVFEIRNAVELPIIGTGGVSCADDALQLIMAGADAVGVGSAVYEGGVELFDQINQGLAAWLKAHGVESLAQVKGVAQEGGAIFTIPYSNSMSGLQNSRQAGRDGARPSGNPSIRPVLAPGGATSVLPGGVLQAAPMCSVQKNSQPDSSLAQAAIGRPPPPCGVGESGQHKGQGGLRTVPRPPPPCGVGESGQHKGQGGLRTVPRPPPPCGVGESGWPKVSVGSPHQPDSPLAQGQGGLKTAGRGSSGEIETLPIREVITHHEELKSVLFEQTFDVEPGQFVMLWIPGVDEKPFSVSDVRDGMIEITAKAVGPFSRALMAVKPGDLLGLRGPLGRGFRPRGRGLIVGGGMGIAPLRMLAHWMEFHGMEFRTALGARTKQELIFADDFARMGAQFATDDGSLGEKGFALSLAEQLCAAETFDVIYGCGPEVMLVALKKLAEQVGCDCQLSLERHMKCGIGVCGSCCVDGSGLCICREGPVLDRAQLDRVADFGLPHRDATGARKPLEEYLTELQDLQDA